MKELLDMFLTFARIGGFTFGGGYAMLPMLQKEVVNGRHWATDEELMDYYAIGQCTPGIIAVNTATFVGYKNRGIPGAIAATLGVIAPSLVIIMIIAAFISNFIELSFVSSAFAGIRACVCVRLSNWQRNRWLIKARSRLQRLCLYCHCLHRFPQCFWLSWRVRSGLY